MSLNASAELAKLAHQLGADEADLDFLAGVPADDLRGLRVQIGEALFQAGKHHFGRMAALAKAVPTPIAVKVTLLTLPPLLAGRTTELLDPRKAVEMVSRMPVGYLADVSASMDPSRSPEVIAAMPADVVGAVGAELAERGEWVVMGAFVSFMNRDALRAAIALLDGEQLLRIGFVLDDAERLAEVSDLLSGEQLDELLTAAPEDGLWREMDDLVGQLDGARVARLAERFAAAGSALDAAYAAGALSPANRTALTGR